MARLSSRKRDRKGGSNVRARREQWHAVLDAADQFEEILIASEMLERGPHRLALEFLHDIKQALLEARPRK